MQSYCMQQTCVPFSQVLVLGLARTCYVPFKKGRRLNGYAQHMQIVKAISRTENPQQLPAVRIEQLQQQQRVKIGHDLQSASAQGSACVPVWPAQPMPSAVDAGPRPMQPPHAIASADAQGALTHGSLYLGAVRGLQCVGWSRGRAHAAQPAAQPRPGALLVAQVSSTCVDVHMQRFNALMVPSLEQVGQVYDCLLHTPQRHTFSYTLPAGRLHLACLIRDVCMAILMDQPTGCPSFV